MSRMRHSDLEIALFGVLIVIAFAAIAMGLV